MLLQYLLQVFVTILRSNVNWLAPVLGCYVFVTAVPDENLARFFVTLNRRDV